MENKELEIVTTIHAHGKSVYVLKDAEGFFWGIPTSSFTDGRLNREYNGLSGLRSSTVQACTKLVLDWLEIDRLVESGCPRLVASFMVLSDVSQLDAEALAARLGEVVF